MALTVQSEVTPIWRSTALPIDDLEQTFTYNGDDQLESISVFYRGITTNGALFDNIEYKQTFTWVGDGMVSAISRWVPA